MLIREVVPHGGLLVEINPDDCYTLAAACRLAADECAGRAHGYDGRALAAHFYDTLTALFEGYALAGAALGYMHPKESDNFTVDGVRAAWRGTMPAEEETR